MIKTKENIVKKILIIQNKMIGDVLTSSILFEAIKKQYPNFELHYLINYSTYPVVENHPLIDNFILLEKTTEKNVIKLINFSLNLRKYKFDIVIDVYSKLSSNIISLLCGAKQKVSYHKGYTSFLYNYNIQRQTKVETGGNLALVHRMQLIEPLGIKISAPKPKIYLTPKEKDLSKEFLIKKGLDLTKPLIMIGVLGSSQNKSYPQKYMAKSIDFILSNKEEVQLLFNYIPNQIKEVKEIYDLCSEKSKSKIFFDVYGKSLRDFISILSHCNALIGNEGGAVNMAKALEIPTFTIFSPWIDKASWSLYEDESNVSVHLKDYKPELYNQPEKDLKDKSLELYEKFEPKFFLEELGGFINQLS